MSPEMDAGKRNSLELVLMVVVFIVSAGVLYFVVRSDDQSSAVPGTSTRRAVGQTTNTELKTVSLAGITAHVIAVAPGDTLWLAGEQTLWHLSKTGQRLSQLPLAEAPTALAVTSSGRVLIAVAEKVFALDGERKLEAFAQLEAGSRVLSLCQSGKQVFLADGGRRQVVACDLQGQLQWQSKGLDGFIIPSPHFSLCPDGEGGVWVVNPGKHRLERIDERGRYQASWQPEQGKGFVGCCNPACALVLASGQVITVEKGQLHCRLFSPAGSEEAVLIPSGTLRGREFRFALALRPDGTVVLLDGPQERLLFLELGR